jgi:hypothetical protein
VNIIINYFFYMLYFAIPVMFCCRTASVYSPDSKSQKYIVIKNTVIAKILISGGIGNDLIVNPWDRNKMSVVGLILYIVILPAYLFYMVIKGMILFNYRGVDSDFLNLLSDSAEGIMWILIILGILIIFIRKALWYMRRRRSR